MQNSDNQGAALGLFVILSPFFLMALLFFLAFSPALAMADVLEYNGFEGVRAYIVAFGFYIGGILVWLNSIGNILINRDFGPDEKRALFGFVGAVLLVFAGPDFREILPPLKQKNDAVDMWMEFPNGALTFWFIAALGLLGFPFDGIRQHFAKPTVPAAQVIEPQPPLPVAYLPPEQPTDLARTPRRSSVPSARQGRFPVRPVHQMLCPIARLGAQHLVVLLPSPAARS